MNRNETQSSVASPPSGSARVRHRRHKYQKALDGRKQPIRGLWVRNGNYVARVTSLALDSGKMRPRWVTLKDDRDANITTLPEARAALERLRTEQRDDELPAPGRVPTLASYIPEYAEHRETLASTGAKRASTVEKEKALLAKWASEIGHLRLSQIKPAHITRFRDKLLRAQYSNRTANLAVMALRGLCKHAKLEGHVKSLAMQDIPKLRERQVKRALVTQADVDKLCDAAFEPLFLEGRLAKQDEKGQPLKNAQQFADYIRLMACCGARRNETLRLRWSDVDFERNQITIGSDGQSKNGEARAVDFNPALEAHLRDMQKRRAPHSQWLFPSPQRGERDTHALTFRESLTLAREAAGLKRFGFHDCRHHFVSFAVMSGIDYMTIARWVGHKDGGVLIGKVYGHLSNEHAQAQAARLNFGPAIVPLPAIGERLTRGTAIRDPLFFVGQTVPTVPTPEGAFREPICIGSPACEWKEHELTDSMDKKELCRRLLETEQKVESLSKLAIKSHEANASIAISHTSREVKIEAIISVLISLVRELAGREGLSDEEFQKHYDKRYQHYYDLGLQTVEDIAPDRAAQIDGRTIAESDAPATYPPLFDEQG